MAVRGAITKRKGCIGRNKGEHVDEKAGWRHDRRLKTCFTRGGWRIGLLERGEQVGNMNGFDWNLDLVVVLAVIEQEIWRVS
jgi:hypothetical protein